MTVEQFVDLLHLGHEQRGVEFKGPGSLKDKHFMAKVVRAVLGMANHRDGGFVIIGVEDESGRLDPVGLAKEDCAIWTHDNVADQVAKYADPSVQFDLEIVTLDEKFFVVLRVYEFDEVPVLCKRHYGDAQGQVLRSGALYIRSRRKPETSEIPTHEDMRALVDLATEKVLRRFLVTVDRAGIGPSLVAGPSDEGQFALQREDAFSSPLADEIRTRGYVFVCIHPGPFAREHVANYGELEPIVEKASVSLGGWAFPHIDRQEPLKRGGDWVGQEFDSSRFRETWRLYQTGQFIHLGGISTDWMDRSVYEFVPAAWKPNVALVGGE